jgi:hypothetical protein
MGAAEHGAALSVNLLKIKERQKTAAENEKILTSFRARLLTP